MSTVESIERQITQLSDKERSELREWFLEAEWQRWDRQLEADVAAGKLDALADQAIADHLAGKSRPL